MEYQGRTMGLEQVHSGAKAPDEINVIIEISARSKPIEYQVDESGALYVSHYLSTPMHYPCDYGYIPKTRGIEHRPLEVLVVAPLPVTRGCVVRCRPIGGFVMTDDAVTTSRIIAVPIPLLTDQYDHVQELSHLPPEQLQKIIHFFSHYRDLDEKKSDRYEKSFDQKDAKQCIQDGIDSFNKSLKKRLGKP